MVLCLKAWKSRSLPGFCSFSFIILKLLLLVSNFSVVIPLYNESTSVEKLVPEIFQSLTKYKKYELILVNDGSNDDTLEVIEKIKKKYSLVVVKNERNKGQSYSIWNGIKKSNYNTIVTLDGDGQNNPKDIPRLLDLYFSKGTYSLIGGIRKNRKDNLLKLISSKIANQFRSIILKDDCDDTGCSLKVFDRETFLSFPFFDGLHRFLPALFKGFGKNTLFIDVDHRPRIAGISKYGTIDRLFKGILDIIRVKKIIRNNILKK